MQKYGFRIIFCYQYKLSRKDQISAKFNLHDLKKKKKIRISISTVFAARNSD